MLDKHAFEWGDLISDLSGLEKDCDCFRRLKPEATTTLSLLRERARRVVAKTKSVSVKSGLDALRSDIARFEHLLQREPLKIEDVQSSAKHLKDHCLDELGRTSYFQVDRGDAGLYDQSGLFGSRVARKFKDADSDIKNAGNCLALQQPTACVFHLMRAVEVAVRRLSRRLGVTITPQTTWRQMTGQMDEKIKRMPEAKEAQKKRKSDWEAARANLHHVGSVWRNKTMHPAGSYTPSQARDIFSATRVLMVSLCDL